MKSVQEFRSYDEAMKDSEGFGDSQNLLLGNGFSISCSKGFNYDNLRDRAEFKDLSVDYKELFKDEDGNLLGDFETVIARLNDAAKVIGLYGGKTNGNHDGIEAMKGDVSCIRKALVNALYDVHPDNAFKICKNPSASRDHYTKIERFLERFPTIYTISYDMILYWAALRIIDRHNGDGMFDGFIDQAVIPSSQSKYPALRWNGEVHRSRRGQRIDVYYLHGALHLYEEGAEIFKLKRGSREYLMDTVRKFFGDSGDRIPLVVTEGSSSEKLNRIENNDYLRHCLNSIESMSGALFTYGVSFSDNDKHIVRQLARAKGLKKVYVGCYGESLREVNNLRSAWESVTEEAGDDRGGEPELATFPSSTVNIQNQDQVHP
ncbi:hypothetical protein CXF45_06550 [Corynebacterium bovis]|uniref:DUF4917 family protein n=1 Tax=Corynebacterium bovis TaxID=36808 RepID=UPI000F6464BA|nr:DUF4917 family protein [Corynebacterium bovis]RRO80469.1 hypothetical protein CXF38_06560 [Corynebacterium bovis]RRO89970.1 hypothetical protein CXF45_06550 [Corynebacterium bovis]